MEETTKNNLAMEISITGKATLTDISDLKDYVECLAEVVEKLREQGSADCTIRVNGEVK